MANAMLERVARAMWDRFCVTTKRLDQSWTGLNAGERMTWMMYASAGVEALSNPEPKVTATGITSDQWNETIEACLRGDGASSAQLNFASADQAREEAYRRGFQQGAEVTTDSIKDDTAPRRWREVRSWVTGDLFRWRYHADLKQPVQPPAPPRSK